jgi:hypothetical protein
VKYLFWFFTALFGAYGMLDAAAGHVWRMVFWCSFAVLYSHLARGAWSNRNGD